MDNILILEDEVTLRNALIRGLKEYGDFDVVGAGFLKEAVASLDVRRPNLVIMDIDLPDGSGLDLVPELALRDLKIPILVISAFLGRFQAELPDSTNVDVLAKPFEFSELLRLVNQRLEQAKREPPAAGFTVADYLQLAGMARRSVVLTVKESGRTLGQIVVQDGAPTWAEDQQGVGEAAFRRLALLQKCEVTCRALEAPLGKSNLSGSLEHLLIDAARFADEKKRAQPAADIGDDSTRITRPAPPPTASAPSPVAPPRPRPPPKPAELARATAAPVRPSGTIAVASNGTPRASSEATQEKPVSPTKPPKMNLNNILALDSSIKAAARADRQGSVLEASGEMDAETACAVVAMAAHEVSEACAEIGVGRPSAWHVSLGASTWYVVHCKEEIIVTLGNATKNPAATLGKVAKSCGV